MTWEEDRPVFGRLPEIGYQNNEPTDWITQQLDADLVTTKNTLENFYLELDPATAQAASLDYLAFLVGLSGEFWDTRWPEQVKRDMIACALTVIWPKRGILEVITKVLTILNVEHSIWLNGVLLLSFPLSGVFALPQLRYIVLLPLKYPREQGAWAEALRVVKNYSPAVVDGQVTYDSFYVDFSVVGEPVFT